VFGLFELADGGLQAGPDDGTSGFRPVIQSKKDDANADAHENCQQQREEKKSHVTPPLPVRSREKQLFYVISSSCHRWTQVREQRAGRRGGDQVLSDQVKSPLPRTRAVSQAARMQSRELLREMFQKCSAKQIGAQLGLLLSMVYKWAEPGDGTGSGAAKLLARLETLLRRTKDPRLIQ
jgi:hypothetical protein